MSDDEIILSELSDDELVQQMHDDLYDGLKEEIEESVRILLERDWTPYDVLTGNDRNPQQTLALPRSHSVQLGRCRLSRDVSAPGGRVAAEIHQQFCQQIKARG